MRAQFLTGLADLAERDPRVVLITADLGFGAIEVFADRHPKRFFNLGVTEQAIVGVATGLAEGGLVPYCYSIAAFSVARTFEFLRNGPIAHGLPVRVVGVGPGLDYSFDGLTHYAIEDLALVGSQPQTIIVAPVDGQRANEFGSTGSDHRGLVYYRLARNVPDCSLPLAGAVDLEAEALVVGLGDCSRIVEGLETDLRAQGVSTRAVMVQVLDRDSIAGIARRIVDGGSPVLVTVESHYVRGGFGTALADELMAQRWTGVLVKWGVESLPVGTLGGQEFVESKYCTSPTAVVKEVCAALARVPT